MKMSIRQSTVSAIQVKRSAVRVATILWVGALSVLVVGTAALGTSQAAPTLDGMIAARTGLQTSTVLAELRGMGPGGNATGVVGYLEKRGVAPLQKSLMNQKGRVERACRKGGFGASECVERLREMVQQQREVDRLLRVSKTQGTEAAKATVRLGAAVFFQQVREEILPEFARSHRGLFSKALTKSNRAPASVGDGSKDEAKINGPADQFDALARSMGELSGAALGMGGELGTQAEAVEQNFREFTR